VAVCESSLGKKSRVRIFPQPSRELLQVVLDFLQFGEGELMALLDRETVRIPGRWLQSSDATDVAY
jgi:hypothetical protein